MQKTHGQKRKSIIFGICALIFCGLTAAGTFFIHNLMSEEYAWVDSASTATGQVTEKESEVDEYRNARGRKRTTTYYYLTYSFTVDGEDIESYTDVNKSDYNSLSVGDPVSVWYDGNDPYYNHALESEVGNGEKTSMVPALISVVPYTFGFCAFLYAILAFLFGRESRKKLAKGFFTDSSWLDVDDNMLVLVDETAIGIARFDKGKAHSITKIYQAGASHKELKALFKDDQFKSCDLASVTKVTSRHDQDTISVSSDDKDLSLDFLNIGTKEHAHERIEALLGDEFDRTDTKRSRIRSVAPRLATIVCLCSAAFFISSFWMWVVAVITSISIFPKMVRRLFNPTVLTQYTRKEISKSDVQVPDTATNDVITRKAA